MPKVLITGHTCLVLSWSRTFLCLFMYTDKYYDMLAHPHIEMYVL